MGPEFVLNADWIGPEYDPRGDLGCFSFRRRFVLSSAPADFWVWVSADQRYELWVNGQRVGFGPCRGDLEHWHADPYDLTPYLKVGENEIIADVWNFGRWAPMAQITARTGFFLSGEGIATPQGWEYRRIPEHDFAMMHSDIGEFYIDIGPGEIQDCSETPPNSFESAEPVRATPSSPTGVDFDPSPPTPSPLERGEGNPSPPPVPNRARPSPEWHTPNRICRAEPRGILTGSTPWMLVPRPIPPMRREWSNEGPLVRHGFLGDHAPLRPDRPLQKGEVHEGPLVLDFGELKTAFPGFHFQGEPGTKLHIIYAEAPVGEHGEKGNRNDVLGKRIAGYRDMVVLGDGPTGFQPLWWRTFRYIQIEPETPAPFRVDEVVIEETGYPYEVSSSFDADDPLVAQIWEVGVRTAKLCAGETYFDCPYYEQLQYAGDTRIQALIGYYLGRDRRLQRFAVDTLGWSMIPEGLTQSRYPSRQTQIIPPFSLWWLLMLWDQALYDQPLLEDRGSQVRAILDWWEGPRAGFWPFGDWVPGWHMGVPPGGNEAMMHQLTYEWAREAMCVLGLASGAAAARSSVVQCGSEHERALAGCLARFRGNAPSPTPPPQSRGGALCTYYFQYYKHKAERPVDYLTELGPWKEMLDLGLTTFAENPEPTRSDCHAWSAHPVLGLFQFVAGVESMGMGWSRASIRPSPGRLTYFDARIAHPLGELRVLWKDGALSVDSPVPFVLDWQGKVGEFEAGRTSV